MARKVFWAVLFVGAMLGVSGCQFGQRIGWECRSFYCDVNRVFLGIDHPGRNGVPESSRQKFFGFPETVRPNPFLD